MAAWPTLAELKKTLDVDSSDFDDVLGRVLASSIEHVKIDVAGSSATFDDLTVDPPYEITDSLAEAARLLAVRMAKAPSEAADQVVFAASRQDLAYSRLLKGQRRSFGIG